MQGWKPCSTQRKPSLSQRVRMHAGIPDEFAFQLIELHQLAVEFTCDVGLPVFVDLGEFRGEIDFVHDGG